MANLYLSKDHLRQVDNTLGQLRSNGAEAPASALTVLLESRMYFDAIGRISTPDMPKVAELLLLLVGERVLVVNSECNENQG